MPIAELGKGIVSEGQWVFLYFSPLHSHTLGTFALSPYRKSPTQKSKNLNNVSIIGVPLALLLVRVGHDLDVSAEFGA